MRKKIIILPAFASSHLLKCSIQNWIDVLEPDVIIINEGLFPNGPENKGHIDDEFRAKWCYKNTNAGFDWEETKNICSQFGDLIQLGIINYESEDAVDSYKQAISNFGDYEVNEGDILICTEPDAFFLESHTEVILDALNNLEIGTGYQLFWKDFLETQYYVEYINEIQPKWRRFAYKFDSMSNYLTAMGDGFMTQNYPKLKKIHGVNQFHYPWFVYDKWKELRYDLIWRKDPQYWKDFENGLQNIRKSSEKYHSVYKSGEYVQIYGASHSDKILIRPSRQDEARWAKFIDISHPKHIHSHPNFVK